MICKATGFVILLAACVIGAKAQICIPDPIYDVILNNSVLSWSPSINCPVTHYIVNIYSGGVLNYVYQAENETLNVSFLSLCRTYTFSITAISEHVIGVATEYETVIPLPLDTNITITNFTADQIDRDLLVQWHVAPELIYCAQSYKLLYWQEDSAVPEEITTNQNGYYILSVAQCSNFSFEVSVLYLDKEHPVADFNYTVPPATNNPSLVILHQNAVSINTTWSLESYSINSCNVTALIVNGTYVNATIPILDLPTRPNIEVTLPGLRPNSMYFFNVTVENSAGTSKPFLLGVQTLPLDPGFQQEVYQSEDAFDSF